MQSEKRSAFLGFAPIVLLLVSPELNTEKNNPYLPRHTNLIRGTVDKRGDKDTPCINSSAIPKCLVPVISSGFPFGTKGQMLSLSSKPLTACPFAFPAPTPFASDTD